jgi:hypothetical protein
MTARTLGLLALILLAASARLIQHPANFAPVCAIAFFGGMHFKSRWAAFLVPLAAMLLSDVAIGIGTHFDVFGEWMKKGAWPYPDMGFVYAGVALVSLLGILLQQFKSIPAIVGGILGSSLLYFLITNLGFWLMINTMPDSEGWTRRPQTLHGLLLVYLDAIPFYKMSLLGDVIYGGVFFGGWALAERLAPAVSGQSSVIRGESSLTPIDN